MQTPEDMILIRRDTLQAALLEMTKQEVRVSFLFTHYMEHLQMLANGMEAVLSDYRHQAAQTELIESLMPSDDWAMLVNETRLAQWEAELKARYFEIAGLHD